MTNGLNRPNEVSRTDPPSSALFAPVLATDPGIFPNVPGLTVDRLIGRGAFATVWLAHLHSHVRRSVAVKVLDAGCGGTVAIERFRREWEALARAAGSGIATLISAGFAQDGRAYLMMEYIEGESITDACERRSLSLRERILLVAQLADIVARIHDKGIVHRDLKPSNIFVGWEVAPARVTILDFGLAAFNDDGGEIARQLTLPGIAIGTPEWMAPEQTGLLSRPAGTAADVWAIGVLIERLWLGRLTRQRIENTPAAVHALLEQIGREERPKSLPPQTSPHWDDLSPAERLLLAALVDRATVRDPIDRSLSVREIATALREIALLERRRSAQPQKFLTRILARNSGIAVIVLLGLGAAWWLRPSPRAPVAEFVLGVYSAGTPLAWGNNIDGRCNLPTDSMLQKVACATDYTIGLRVDGSILAVGSNALGACDVPAALAGPNAHVIDIAARADGGLALTDDGHVHAWGSRRSIPEPNEHIARICASDTMLISVTDAGAIAITDPHPSAIADPPRHGKFSIAAIAHKTAAAIDEFGHIQAWGSDATGIISQSIGLNARAIALTGFTSATTAMAFIDSNGQLRILGGGIAGKLPAHEGGWQVQQVVGARDGAWFGALRTDGSVEFIGDVPASVREIPQSLRGAVINQIAVGSEHVVVLVRR